MAHDCKIFLVLGLILTFACELSCAKYTEQSALESEDDRIIYKKYMDLDKQLKQLMNSGTKMILPFLMQATENVNISPRCAGNIMLLMNGIKKLKLSAIKFLDSTGKISEGFLDGNMHMLGDYEECLNTTMEQRKGQIAFRGQYCLIQYRPILPKKKRPITLDGGIEELVEATKNASEVIQFIVSKAHLFYYNPSKFGICVPSGCEKTDIDQIVKYYGDTTFFDANVAYCDMDDEVFLDTRKITYMSLLVFVASLAAFGTALEYYSWKRDINLKKPVIKGLMCFSVLTNFPRTISPETSTDSIACLYGIRALTLFYVILLHQYYSVVKYFISSHAGRILDEIPQFFMQIVANGFLIADVFFFLGGLVNCYTRMKMKNTEKRKTNFLLLISHRLWRIFPTYLFFCFLMAMYRPYGPMRLYEKKEYVEKCLKYWWQNALFINNFFLQDDTCAPHSWYLAADMQLFLLSLLTIPVFFRHPKRGIILNSAMVFLGILITVISAWVTKITPGVLFYRPNTEEINKAWNANTLPFCHISSYFTGILMGYFLAVKRDVKITTLCQMIGWPIAALLFTSMLFMTKIWNSGGLFTSVESAFYFGFSKFLFALAIGWMVLCCTSGSGGIINYILCLPVWIPIARISYVVYLIAPFLQTFYFANSRALVDGHRMPLIWRYAGDTAISILLGLVIAVLIEAPFKAVEKLLFQRWSLEEGKEPAKPTDIVIKSITGDKLDKTGS